MRRATGGQIKVQVFDGNGIRVGGEFTVNSNSQNYQHSPAIAALSGGRFIVTWTDNSGIGTDNQDDAIRAQIFSVSSAPGPGRSISRQASATTMAPRRSPSRFRAFRSASEFVGRAAQLHGDGWQYQRRCDRLVVRMVCRSCRRKASSAT